MLGSKQRDSVVGRHPPLAVRSEMNRKLTVAAALIGSAALLLGMGTIANADHRGKAIAGIKANGPLNKLVAAGTISQAEADAVKAGMKAAVAAKRAELKAAHDARQAKVLADLVANGTINQAAADLIKAGGNSLRDSVRAGTITYAQLGAVHDAMRAAKPVTDPMKDLVKKVTDQLVAESKLSTAGAAAIVAALPANNEGHFGKKKGDRAGFGNGPGKGHGGKGMRF